MSWHINDPRKIASTINAMKPGQCYRLSIDVIQDMRGDLWRSPLEIIHDNIIGSNYGSVTVREDLETGDYIYTRNEDP